MAKSLDKRSEKDIYDVLYGCKLREATDGQSDAAGEDILLSGEFQMSDTLGRLYFSCCLQAPGMMLVLLSRFPAAARAE
jgi:hypothetical protein